MSVEPRGIKNLANLQQLKLHKADDLFLIVLDGLIYAFSHGLCGIALYAVQLGPLLMGDLAEDLLLALDLALLLQDLKLKLDLHDHEQGNDLEGEPHLDHGLRQQVLSKIDIIVYNENGRGQKIDHKALVGDQGGQQEKTGIDAMLLLD